MTTTIIPSADRAYWPGPDIISRQSFPATGSTTMTDYAFGLLLIHNDDIVEPGEGFDMHQHQDVEIVSWIVDGRLRHRDSTGTVIDMGAGQAEAITAGHGVMHSEVNAAGLTGTDDLRVIQMWLPTDETGLSPSHSIANLNAELAGGGFVTVAAGDNDPDAALHIHTAGARLRAARLAPGTSVDTDAAAYSHIFIVTGDALISPPTSTESAGSGHQLHEGDTARLTAEGPVRLTAPADGAGAEILVWEMARSVRTDPR